MFKLYTHPVSANGRKVLALSHHLKLKPDIKMINVYKGEGQTTEYLSINPLGKIPTLVEKDFVLCESNAILQYISDVYGSSNLSPSLPQAKANIARWLFWESSHWQPSTSVVLSGVVGHRLIPHLVPAPLAEPNWADPNFDNNVKFLESHLKNVKFLTGSDLTIADFSIAGMMTYFKFAKFPFQNFPNLARWYESIEALDAWKKTAVDTWTIDEITPANKTKLPSIPK